MTEIPEAGEAGGEPLYNIGVVSRMTGISVATLRAWERRYGYPSSARTAGGHRLYSERDVLRLHWIKDQIDLGLQTAQAIQALRHREEQAAYGSGPGSLPATPLPAEPLAGAAASLARWRVALRAALVHHDMAAADQILGEALLSAGLDDLALNVIVPVFDDIGRLWEAGEITVALEHLTTHYLRHRLLQWMIGGPSPFPMRPVLLAAAPGELHEGGLLILAALLRRRRWPVAYLGQNVPLADLAALARDLLPPVVVIVATTEDTATRLADWPRAMPDLAANGRSILAFGGRIFSESPEWRDRVPGLFLGASLQEGLERLDGLLQDALVHRSAPETLASHVEKS